jgi:hypothetical protein
MAVVGATNVLVDPFCLFPSLEIRGFNAVKPEVYSHVRMIKAHNVRFAHAKGLILGTSRAEFGLDPQHPDWRVGSVYNLALPNASIYEAQRYLEHAYTQNPVQQVVLALDLGMFNAGRLMEVDFVERTACPHPVLPH